MRRSHLFALALALGLLAGGVPAPRAGETPAQTSILPQLTPEQRAFVARAEAFLNDLRSVQARFLQISSTGNYAEGTVSLLRPNRLRLDYDPPAEILVVANGSHLIYNDKKLDQVTYIGLDETPLGVLLRDHIVLSDPQITLTGYREAGGVAEISLVQTKDPGQGTLTLVFTVDPVDLRQWRVLDAQNIEVTVSLFDPRRDIKLDPKLFQFSAPTQRRDR
ncbi:LolA family protein [Pararhodospirillum photometricum]|uniref:Outer membrane lipoprotein carrier protein LolA n=1 Tax=Pararhodospirillum photometricum DSM 122 TaxID=1150469 RepID=H6SS77_PARPM|nr:outer membrane lipoprotein carrier protein LolA [Pararhodospirillum photometricum]CCG07756.1 Outer membrane lipoprotein carrier protein LolA [Pararhodospirillum photometricum DSM 122]